MIWGIKLVGALALLLGIVWGCSTDFSDLDEKTFCRQQADCIGGYLCVQGECIRESALRPPGGGWRDAGVASPDVGVGRVDARPPPFGHDAGPPPVVGDAAPPPKADADPATDTAPPTDTRPPKPDVLSPDAGPPPVLPGDIVVTEIMIDPGGIAERPPDADGEWLELFNPTDATISLAGWELEDEGGFPAFIFGEGVEIEPSARLVVGTNNDGQANGGVTVDVVAPDIRLNNQEGFVELRAGAAVIDRVAWSRPDWPVLAGGAISLDPTKHSAAANDLPGNWCTSSRAFRPRGDRGTPGGRNPPCPERAPVSCEAAIDASEGGLFGWDLALARIPNTDYHHDGYCVNPFGPCRRPMGAGAPNVVFRVRSGEARLWTFDLQALSPEADIAMYVWAGSCPKECSESCADDVINIDTQREVWHAVIEDDLFLGDIDYFVVVDGYDHRIGIANRQPFTLNVSSRPAF